MNRNYLKDKDTYVLYCDMAPCSLSFLGQDQDQAQVSK